MRNMSVSVIYEITYDSVTYLLRTNSVTNRMRGRMSTKGDDVVRPCSYMGQCWQFETVCFMLCSIASLSSMHELYHIRYDELLNSLCSLRYIASLRHQLSLTRCWLLSMMFMCYLRKRDQQYHVVYRLTNSNALFNSWQASCERDAKILISNFLN